MFGGFINYSNSSIPLGLSPSQRISLGQYDPPLFGCPLSGDPLVSASVPVWVGPILPECPGWP